MSRTRSRKSLLRGRRRRSFTLPRARFSVRVQVRFGVRGSGFARPDPYIRLAHKNPDTPTPCRGKRSYIQILCNGSRFAAYVTRVARSVTRFARIMTRETGSESRGARIWIKFVPPCRGKRGYEQNLCKQARESRWDETQRQPLSLESRWDTRVPVVTKKRKAQKQ